MASVRRRQLCIPMSLHEGSRQQLSPLSHLSQLLMVCEPELLQFLRLPSLLEG
jgi:hypothetical protein